MSAHNSCRAEYSDTVALYAMMVMPKVFSKCHRRPLCSTGHSEVTWVQLGIQPIFLAALGISQEQADRGGALARNFNYLWSQLHRRCRRWIWLWVCLFFLTSEKLWGLLLDWSPWDSDCKCRVWNFFCPSSSSSAQTEVSEVGNSSAALLCCTVHLPDSCPPLGSRVG